jgi:survival-of-motor-neuron-related-splicing factor 30
VVPPELNVPSALPASVAEQIRRAQVRAAIMGQADAAWAIGSQCQAVYGADGQWYTATVEAVTPDGKFVVAFEGYADKEHVDLASIRPLPEVVEIYQGVAAPKRKRVEEQPQVTEVPKVSFGGKKGEGG